MAISAVYYRIIRAAHKQGVLPKDARILELGEANWYGDLATDHLRRDIGEIVADPGRRAALLALINNTGSPTYGFDLAKAFYGAFFGRAETVAIDFHGTPNARRLDLNLPIDLGERFDVAIDNGTVEHIFNAAQAFKTMHDHTRPGGLMIHETPFTGWYNHGFYNLQPTIYYDLAAANRYRIEGFFCCRHLPPFMKQIGHPHELLDAVKANEIPANSLLVCFLRKIEDAPFRTPMQGYYAGTLDEKQANAWKSVESG